MSIDSVSVQFFETLAKMHRLKTFVHLFMIQLFTVRETAEVARENSTLRVVCPPGLQSVKRR